jgi:hypothetical protein
MATSTTRTPSKSLSMSDCEWQLPLFLRPMWFYFALLPPHNTAPQLAPSQYTTKKYSVLSPSDWNLFMLKTKLTKIENELVLFFIYSFILVFLKCIIFCWALSASHSHLHWLCYLGRLRQLNFCVIQSFPLSRASFSNLFFCIHSLVY